MCSTTTTRTLHSMASSSSCPVMTSPLTHGKINYVPADHTPIPSPHNFHLPSMAEFSDSRTLPLHDLRPLPTLSQLPNAENHASLSTHNFTALNHPSVMHSPPYSYASWKDPTLLQAIYVPETEEMVKRVTGAKKVITEALLLRSVLWTEEDALATHAGHGTKDQQDEKLHIDSKSDASESASMAFPQFIGFDTSTGSGASPAPKVHQDYTPSGARTHLRCYHPALRAAAHDIIAAEDSASSDPPSPPPSRWALYSVWRPLKPVKRDPLALCDARSVRDEEYVPIMVRTPTLGRSGAGGGKPEVHECEAWLARASQGDGLEGEGHRWYWLSEQSPAEVLVIGLFDSSREGDGLGAGGAMHCSVELVGANGVEEARESLELRCLAVW